MDSEPEQSGAEYEEQDEGPPAQKIWILCGGTGSRADESLASGIHVYHEFLKHPDVLVSLLGNPEQTVLLSLPMLSVPGQLICKFPLQDSRSLANNDSINIAISPFISLLRWSSSCWRPHAARRKNWTGGKLCWRNMFRESRSPQIWRLINLKSCRYKT